MKQISVGLALLAALIVGASTCSGCTALSESVFLVGCAVTHPAALAGNREEMQKCAAGE